MPPKRTSDEVLPVVSLPHLAPGRENQWRSVRLGGDVIAAVDHRAAAGSNGVGPTGHFPSMRLSGTTRRHPARSTRTHFSAGLDSWIGIDADIGPWKTVSLDHRAERAAAQSGPALGNPVLKRPIAPTARGSRRIHERFPHCFLTNSEVKPNGTSHAG